MGMKHFLQKRHIPFEVLSHPRAVNAMQLANALKLDGKEVAKSVLLRDDHDHRFILAVLPAIQMIDLTALSTILGGMPLAMATENEIAGCCPDCEIGVLPPFGSHIGAQTVVDASLSEAECIWFEGDTHAEAVGMKYSDYYNYEHPHVTKFACAR